MCSYTDDDALNASSIDYHLVQEYLEKKNKRDIGELICLKADLFLGVFIILIFLSI